MQTLGTVAAKKLDLSAGSIAESGSYLSAIDGLRGVAILMVMMVHSSQFVGNDHSGSFRSIDLEKFVNAGARGVQLFFMVSAFTLFSSSYKRFKVDLFPKTFFYIRRAFRILPAWWLMIAFITFYHHLQIKNIVPSLFFYFGFIRFDPVYDINPQGWSLFVEECFYILLPIIFLYVSDLKKSLIFSVVCLAIFGAWSKWAGMAGVPAQNNFIFLFPLSHWYCFAFGISIYYLNEKWQARTRGSYERYEAFVLDLAAVTAMVLWLEKTPVVASCGLVFFFFAALDTRTVIGKAIQNRVLIRFGQCCYSIYLFHVTLLIVLSPLMTNALNWGGLAAAPVDIRFLTYFPVFALIALGLGLISFYTLERPCVHLGKKVITKILEKKASM